MATVTTDLLKKKNYKKKLTVAIYHVYNIPDGEYTSNIVIWLIGNNCSIYYLQHACCLSDVVSRESSVTEIKPVQY